MISLALVILFFTSIALLNFITVNVLRLLTTKISLFHKIKDKEQRVTLVLLHLCYTTLITSVSLWITITGWNKSNGNDTIEYDTIYFTVIQVGIAFYLHDILVLTTGKGRGGIDSARLIHHYISICAYVGVLEEPKAIFYSATMSIELYKVPLIMIQLLYYFELMDHWSYVLMRFMRFILWLSFKTASIIINIVVSFIHGFPDINGWYYTILLFGTLSMLWYNLYIVYSDIKYFYGLIRKRINKEQV